MTSDINSFTDANGQPIQPYYAAFMIERGYRIPPSGAQTDYVLWNGARWREFRALLGITEDQQRFHREDFRAWLQRRAHDHAARYDIEGTYWVRPAPSRHRSPQLKFGF
jgi:hypothetical protein